MASFPQAADLHGVARQTGVPTMRVPRVQSSTQACRAGAPTVAETATGLIACLTDSSLRTSKETSGFRLDLIASFARRMQYGCEVFDLAKFDEGSLDDALQRAGVKGILLGESAERVLGFEMNWNRYSVVGLGKKTVHRQFHHVSTSDYDSIWLLWEQLYQRGYRRIGPALMAHEFPLLDDRIRRSAAQSCQEYFHKKKERIPLFLGGFGEIEPFEDWVTRYRPEVVIGFHTGIYYWLKDEFRMALPEEIGFATLHGDATHLQSNGIAGLEGGQEEACRAAVELLDQQVRLGYQGIPRHPQQTIVQPYFIDGPSLLPGQPPSFGKETDRPPLFFEAD